jgi:lysophospholipase L1-like esterase
MKRPILLPLIPTLLLSVSAIAQLSNERIYDTIGFIPDHYPQRIAKFQSEPIVTGRIIFLGNSITEIGPWAKLTGDTTVVNRGIGGDITYGVLKRLDDVIARQPSKVFLLIGINDIGKDIPDTVIADNIRKIVAAILQGSPTTKIYVQSILPLNPDVKNFPQHYNKEEHVLNVNAMLPGILATLKCTFINIFPLLLDDKQRLDAQYTLDGLHVNQKGYVIWVNYLKKQGYL